MGDLMTPVLQARSANAYHALQDSNLPRTKNGETFADTFMVASTKAALRQNDNDTGVKTADFFNIENSVILTAMYNKTILREGIMGYGDMKYLFLPLGDTAEMMDFNISVDPDAGTAKGWFISKDRDFALDLSKGSAVVDGQVIDIPQGAARVVDQDIFLDAETFSQWFPVNFKYNFHQQSIELLPRETLPFQAMADRNDRREAIGQGTANTASLPRMEDHYKLLEPLTADITLKGSHESGKKRENGFQGGYSVLAQGDIGKMSADLFFSGDDENGLKNSRITLERGDPDGNLLGPLNATRVCVGDVRVPNFPVQSGGKNEIGTTITNQDLDRTREYDTTHFEGDLSPGWDVEIYRNGNLVGSQRVGPEGRYEFEDVALFYGENNFELIFYGPQGQKKNGNKTLERGAGYAPQG